MCFYGASLKFLKGEWSDYLKQFLIGADGGLFEVYFSGQNRKRKGHKPHPTRARGGQSCSLTHVTHTGMNRSLTVPFVPDLSQCA